MREELIHLKTTEKHSIKSETNSSIGTENGSMSRATRLTFQPVLIQGVIPVGVSSSDEIEAWYDASIIWFNVHLG